MKYLDKWDPPINMNYRTGGGYYSCNGGFARLSFSLSSLVAVSWPKYLNLCNLPPKSENSEGEIKEPFIQLIQLVYRIRKNEVTRLIHLPEWTIWPLLIGFWEDAYSSITLEPDWLLVAGAFFTSCRENKRNSMMSRLRFSRFVEMGSLPQMKVDPFI